MNYRFNLFIAFFCILTSSFNGQISADISSGCAPLTVGFTAPSGMSTYYWDFDNGGSSTDQNPSGVIFNTPKNPYSVTLRACKSCPVLFSYSIQVFPKPSITATPIKGCAPISTAISPNISLPPGVSATSLKYIYSDGGSNTLNAPTISPDVHYFGAGTHTATFELTTSPTNAGCNHSVTLTDLVKASNLNIGIISNPSSGCIIPLTVNFSANSIADRPIVSYAWNFGNGKTATTANATSIYNSFGSFTITLVVTDDYGCVKTVTKSILIKENDLTKIISVDTVCVDENISLDHDGNTNLNSMWNLPGSTLGTFIPLNPCWASYNSIGLKTISVTTSYNNSCPKTVTKNILVVDPKIEYTITPRPLCNKTNTFTLKCTNPQFFKNIEWKISSPDLPWYFRIISKSFDSTITFTIDDLDTFAWQYKRLFIEIRAESKYGCYRYKTDSNFISPIIAHVVPTATLGCVPLRIGFYDKTTRYRKDTIVEWTMVYGDGTSQVFTTPFDTIFHTYTSRGTYDMRMVVKNKYGCTDTTYVTKIDAGDVLTPDFTIIGNNLCASDPNSVVTLQSTLPDLPYIRTKFWSNGFQCTDVNALSYIPKHKAGTYNIKMEVNDNGCFSQIIKPITIRGPVALYQDTQSCDKPSLVRFNNQSQLATSYLWDFGDGTTSSIANPSHTYAKDSIYKVKLIAFSSSSGCPPDTFIKLIQIQTPHAQLDKDSFVFCSDSSKILKGNLSSGFLNDSIHTGLIWEFSKSIIPNVRTRYKYYNYNYNDTIKDTVILTAINFMNCKHSDTAIIVIDRIDASPTMSPRLFCSGDTIRYSASDSSYFPIISQKWLFGDGASKTVDPTFHIYAFNKSANYYVINYNSTNSIGCKYSFKDSINIKKLNLSISSTKDMCISNLTNVLTVNTNFPSKYNWVLPDFTSATGKSINYTFPSEAKYPFKVIAIDSFNSNCTDTIQDTINAWNRPDLYIFSDKDTINTLCHPMSLDLRFIDTNHTSLINSSILWSRINSAGLQYFYIPTPSTPLTIGNNKFTIIASNQYCTDTTIRNYIVKAPNGKIDINRNDICKGDEITFTIKDTMDVTDFSIDFGDGTVSKDISPIKHKYNYVPLGGITKAKVIFATNINQCVGPPIDTTIRIYEVFAKFGINNNGDTQFCKMPVPLKDSSLGANSYRWDFGDGTTSFNSNPGSKNYSYADTFKIKLYIENSIYGCKDSFEKSVILLPLPKLKLKNDTICLGDTAIVFNQFKESKVAYYWKQANQFIFSSPIDTNRISIQNNSTYSIIGVDSVRGCKDSINAQLMVLKPIQSYRLDTIIAPGADVTLPFNLISNYSSTWVPDSFLSCIGCPNPVATYILNPIIYKVYYRELLKNCFLDSSIYKIRIFPDILINVPTAFTPNGDGNNDIFYARGFGIKRLTSFKIYNRWGQLLFYTQNELEGWDGYYKNVLQNSDTYFYTIQGESYVKGKNVNKEGNFILMR